jgi:hypothetical protein
MGKKRRIFTKGGIPFESDAEHGIELRPLKKEFEEKYKKQREIENSITIFIPTVLTAEDGKRMGDEIRERGKR